MVSIRMSLLNNKWMLVSQPEPSSINGKAKLIANISIAEKEPSPLCVRPGNPIDDISIYPLPNDQ